MPKEKQKKMLCVEDLRHAEYYGMQDVFDNLYDKSKKGFYVRQRHYDANDIRLLA